MDFAYRPPILGVVVSGPDLCVGAVLCVSHAVNLYSHNFIGVLCLLTLSDRPKHGTDIRLTSARQRVGGGRRRRHARRSHVKNNLQPRRAACANTLADRVSGRARSLGAHYSRRDHVCVGGDVWFPVDCLLVALCFNQQRGIFSARASCVDLSGHRIIHGLQVSRIRCARFSEHLRETVSAFRSRPLCEANCRCSLF